MKSRDADGIAIVKLVCFLTLLTLFGSKYFRVVHAMYSNHSQNECHPPLCTTAQLRSPQITATF
jgi:hypothetical protein